MFKILLLWSLLLSPLAAHKYNAFLDAEILQTEQMNENNITEEQIKELLDQQEAYFKKTLQKLVARKEYYIKNANMYQREIFSLSKIININERAGNTYAVARDKIAVDSYKVVAETTLMIKCVLEALSSDSLKDFEVDLNDIVTQNQKAIAKIKENDYSSLSHQVAGSKVLSDAKKNLKELNAIIELNNAIISYLYNSLNDMYRLNKYSKYYMLNVAMYVNNIDFVHSINSVLKSYHLNVVKIIFIFLLILLVYLFRKIALVAFERYLLSIKSISHYTTEILAKIRKVLTYVVLSINANMVVYVYNDFSNPPYVGTVFNVIYVFLITLLLYKLINALASIRLKNYETSNTNVKNDLINVGLKIVNFVIFIIGLLVVLFFAGVDLTAVLSGLGIGGFAVAFAAKDTISNFFGTLSVLFSDVFSQGDWIEIDGVEGVVIEIGLRVTTIRTFDNAMIAVPNGTFAAKEIKNWNKRILGRRIKMNIGVKYDSKSEDIKNAIAQIRVMLDKHKGIATKATKFERHRKYDAKLVSKNDLEGVKNTLLVYLDDFGDSSINILIYCFSKSILWEEWLKVKEDVMHQIMKILEENNLEFAFPSLSIYNEDMTKTLTPPKEV